MKPLTTKNQTLISKDFLREMKRERNKMTKSLIKGSLMVGTRQHRSILTRLSSTKLKIMRKQDGQSARSSKTTKVNSKQQLKCNRREVVLLLLK